MSEYYEANTNIHLLRRYNYGLSFFLDGPLLVLG